MSDLDRSIATMIIATDTLWGGDVMNPSGVGRFIADSWFSDTPLPEAYTHATAAAVRETGGVEHGRGQYSHWKEENPVGQQEPENYYVRFLFAEMSIATIECCRTEENGVACQPDHTLSQNLIPT